MTLEEALDQINKAVGDYHTLKLSLVSEQSEILRNLSTGLYYLELYRVEYKELWNDAYHKKEGSNPVKIAEADFKTPELYKIRRIMNGCKTVIDAVRSTISTNR